MGQVLDPTTYASSIQKPSFPRWERKNCTYMSHFFVLHSTWQRWISTFPVSIETGKGGMTFFTANDGISCNSLTCYKKLHALTAPVSKFQGSLFASCNNYPTATKSIRIRLGRQNSFLWISMNRFLSCNSIYEKYFHDLYKSSGSNGMQYSFNTFQAEKPPSKWGFTRHRCHDITIRLTAQELNSSTMWSGTKTT